MGREVTVVEDRDLGGIPRLRRSLASASTVAWSVTGEEMTYHVARRGEER